MLIFDNLEITEGNFLDYKKLHKYHYLKKNPGQFTHIFCIRPKLKALKNFPDPIGVHTFSMPMPQLRGRDKATSGFFRDLKSRSKRLKRINKNIRYASRIIIDPRFHNLGLAKWLIKETLPRVNFAIIESILPIDYTNKIFVKAGYQKHLIPTPPYYKHLVDAIQATGLTVDYHLLPETFQKRLEKLNNHSRYNLEIEIQRFLSRYKGHHNMKPNLERTRFILDRLQYPKCYLIWFNPKIKISR